VPVISESNYLGDVLKFEVDNLYCREEVTVLAGAGATRELLVGTVLGKITASGKVKAIDFAAADGSEAAFGVLLYDVTAPDGADAVGVALVDGPAVVASNGLIWPAGATANQKATAIAQLKAAGIKVREGA
jgi:hypothetical protein